MVGTGVGGVGGGDGTGMVQLATQVELDVKAPPALGAHVKLVLSQAYTGSCGVGDGGGAGGVGAGGGGVGVAPHGLAVLALQ